MGGGRGHGIANVGYRASDSCRMEKGYLLVRRISRTITTKRDWIFVALEKGDFIA
jgi:glycine cleavage system aminomethyltransferase T